MDINLIKTYMETSPYILEDILNIMKYRNLRTEQSYYARLAYEYDHVPISQQCKEVRNAGLLARGFWNTKSQRLDQERRNIHNKALISFNSIMRVGEQNNLESLFNGKKLTNEEIVRYERAERREELTDTMFEMLYTIENSVISQEGTKANEYIGEIKSGMRTFNKSYNVAKSMTKDESREKDGGIEFDLSTLFDNDITEY